VLRVHLDYVFAYPVEPPARPADWMRLVARNYSNVDFATWDDPGGALEPWLREWNDGGTAGARLRRQRRLHPPAVSGRPGQQGQAVRRPGRPVQPVGTAAVRERLPGRHQNLTKPG
jgi:hypothetical protein